ncbi:MAG: leucine-rich repeat domain-containing protein, partial [Clostridiales bacterium]|nr:leucine-rich repeat domain-containing protein [Clostridiales bacterium]
FNAELKCVGDGALAYCENLVEIIMNDGLDSISNNAFYGCGKLQEVVIPDSVSSMGGKVFDYCTALKYVKLPASLDVINYDLFLGCEALESVVLPQSLTIIARAMLTDCPDTVKVYYCGSEQQWNAIQINDDNTVLNNATKYYYSETGIEGVNCWHYGADGKPSTTY